MDTNVHYDPRESFKTLKKAIADGDVATMAACDFELKETNDLYFEELLLSIPEKMKLATMLHQF